MVLSRACIFFLLDAASGVVIPYHQYSSAPTIGNGNGTSNPADTGYGAMRIFIQKAANYTSSLPGQDTTVTFVPIQSTGRAENALRPGVQLARGDGSISGPSWGFLYNSMPFAMSFPKMLEFLFDAAVDDTGRTGVELAQGLLDAAGGTQVAFPVVGSTAQGSGYFPSPIGEPRCNDGDSDCLAHGRGIGLAGLCQSNWTIRFLKAPGDVLSLACDRLVDRGVIPSKALSFYPAVGGEPVLEPMQRRDIHGFEFVTPADDLKAFFPTGNLSGGHRNCEGSIEGCTQNIGQIGARYAHYPGWHQPFLLSWMHVSKGLWQGLSLGQQDAIRRAAQEAVVESYEATASIQCQNLRNMLNINAGIHQLNHNGSARKENGISVSAQMTLTPWPLEDLNELRTSAAVYLDTRASSDDAFASVYQAMRGFADAGIPIRSEDLGPFPTAGCLLSVEGGSTFSNTQGPVSSTQGSPRCSAGVLLCLALWCLSF